MECALDFLSNLDTRIRNDYVSSTLVHQNSHQSLRTCFFDTNHFIQELYANCPLLKAISGETLKDFAIFGGCLADIVLKKRIKDIDMAYMSVADQSIQDGIANLVSDIRNHLLLEETRHRKQNIVWEGVSSEDILLFRQKELYTIVVGSDILQIHSCSSLRCLMDKIDFAPTAIVLYQGGLWASTQAIDSWNRLCFDMHPTDSVELAERKKKYFNKGFEATVSELDLNELFSKCKQRFKYNLQDVFEYGPYIIFVNSIDGTRIKVDHVELQRSMTDSIKNGGHMSSTSPFTIASAIRHNAKRLSKCDADLNHYFFWGKGGQWASAFSSTLSMTRRQLMKTYDTLLPLAQYLSSENMLELSEFFEIELMRELYIFLSNYAFEKATKTTLASDIEIKFSELRQTQLDRSMSHLESVGNMVESK